MAQKILFALFFTVTFINAQEPQGIQSGPMLGYVERHEAAVWIQTKDEAEVYALYDDLGTEQQENYSTNAVLTKKADGFTAQLLFTDIKENRNYSYRIYVDSVEYQVPYPLRFQTPKADYDRDELPSYTIAMGSCTYVNDNYSEESDKYAIFESILKKKPDAMLWLGDNTYLRDGEWASRTGYIERYTHTRSLSEMQELLASCPNFAIWDDHEFGPNNATGSWVHKDIALDVFKLFWANPSYGTSDLTGTSSAFRWVDVDFFMMDNRYNRTNEMQSGEEHIFGRPQADLLIDRLKYSNAPFKIVLTGGQFLNTARVYENHANYEEERDYLLKRISEENIKGVVFISGDRHHSEVMEAELANGEKILEFTVSPLTSRPNRNVTETNQNRVDGSLIQQRNFGTMQVSGAYKERILDFTFYDTDGQELFQYQIKASDIYREDE